MGTSFGHSGDFDFDKDESIIIDGEEAKYATSEQETRDRWRRRVNKDTELMPLMRLQYRGLPDEARKAFLYENVTDAKGRSYDIKVLTGAYGCSRQIMALGMGCEDPLV